MSQMDRSIAVSYTAMLAVQLTAQYTYVPVYLQMITLATLTIYIGTRMSLRPTNDTARSVATSLLGAAAGTVDTEKANAVEQLETKDAYMFPIIGGVVLTSLFLIFKFVPKSLIAVVVQCYFGVIGTAVLTAKMAQLMRYALSADIVQKLDQVKKTIPNPVYHVDHFVQRIVDKYNSKPADTVATTTTTDSTTTATDAKAASTHNHKSVADKAVEISEQPHVDITLLSFIAFITSACTFAAYTTSDYFLLNNLFAICFAVQGIELLSLGSTKNGFILLCGLFAYDIFFVFGTTIMVSVAKNFDAPIKLLFPIHNTVTVDNVTLTKHSYSMLGLGDIVIPGIFIALMLRFDLQNYMAAVESTINTAVTPRVLSVQQRIPHLKYFTTCIVSYVGGLVLTIAIMYMFDAAQPALLYLVPALLISNSAVALFNRQFSTFFNYAEEAGDEKKEVSTEAETKKVK